MSQLLLHAHIERYARTNPSHEKSRIARSRDRKPIEMRISSESISVRTYSTSSIASVLCVRKPLKACVTSVGTLPTAVLTIALPAAIASRMTHPTLSPLVGYAKRSKP